MRRLSVVALVVSLVIALASISAQSNVGHIRGVVTDAEPLNVLSRNSIPNSATAVKIRYKEPDGKTSALMTSAVRRTTMPSSEMGFATGASSSG